MSFRTVLIVLLALVCGGSAAIGINNLRSQEPAGPSPDMVPVVVAAADITRGTTVTPELITTKDFPKAVVPAGAITKKEDALERTVYVPFLKDEMLLDPKLASKSAGRGLAPLIPRGMRACTITTNISSGVAGFILPGNHVDVLLSLTTQGGTNDLTGGASTATLLQNVEILAVDQRMEAPAENKVDLNLRSVTLLVTQEQAARLELGQAKGTLHLTLRNPNDDKPANARPATLSEIQMQQDKPPEKPWDEKVKGILEFWTKVSTVKETYKQVAKQIGGDIKGAIPAGPPPARIRTLRGTAEGMVLVQDETADQETRR